MKADDILDIMCWLVIGLLTVGVLNNQYRIKSLEDQMRLIVNESGRLEISKTHEPVNLVDGFGNKIEVSRSGGDLVLHSVKANKTYVMENHSGEIKEKN